MSAASLNLDIDEMLRAGLATVPDPGASGTIVADNMGRAICEVVTAGAESRVLESATHFGVGTKLLVVFKTDGGDLTINSDDSSVLATAAGDCAEFVVSLAGSTKVWRTVFANVT